MWYTNVVQIAFAKYESSRHKWFNKKECLLIDMKNPIFIKISKRNDSQESTKAQMLHLAVVVGRIQRTTYPIEIKERKQTKSNHPVSRA